MHRLNELTSTAVALLAAMSDLILVTLAVAWVLEGIVYFSLFIGLPLGIASAVVVYLLVKKNMTASD